MARRPRLRQRRNRIFIGCEGQSERGYAALLSLLVEEVKLPLHLDSRVCHGGNPLSIVENSVAEMRRQTARRGAYTDQAVFLDGDHRSDSPDRTARANRLITDNNLRPIWSMPNFEALLLIHLPGCERLQPPTSDIALQELRNRWPDYAKGMSATELRQRIDMAAVGRAAGVHRELRLFLISIGLLR